MTTLLQDLRFALRQLRRSPGFAITAVVILALGIAANVIVFGVLQTMILQPVDVPHPERLVTFAPHPSDYPAFSYPEVRDVRDGNTVFSAVAAVAISYFGMEVNGAAEPVWGEQISGQYFAAVAIKPFLGRLLTPADVDHPGSTQAVVISYPAWKSRFNADPHVVGRTVRIDRHSYTIVGVTPEGFYGTEKFLLPDLFVPMTPLFPGDNWMENRSNKNVFPLARVKDGVSLAQAQAELNILAKRIQKQDPKDEDGLQFWLAPPGLIGNFVRHAARSFFAGMMGLAGIVLLAACANLGSLFAARTSDRTREIAIRIAIGSSRWRIFRQVLIEAVLISVMGGACACALSWTALSALARWQPPTDYPVHFQVEPQLSLILIAFAVSLIAGVFFGIMPLRQIFKADPSDAIKSGSSTVSTGRRWALRDVLLAAQIALCCVTVTAAFVALRGLSKTLSTDIGIQPQHATLTKFALGEDAYPGVAGEHLQRSLQEKLSNLPGVEAVGYASDTPLGDTVTTPVFTQQTTDLKLSNSAFDSFYYDVSPGYFAAAGTPLLAGRDVLATDTAKTPFVAVVNQKFVKSLFHLEKEHADSAVGRYFKNHDNVLIQIVGIVPDGKYFLTSEDPQEAVFFPILQQPNLKTSVLVRMRGDASSVAVASMANTVRKTIHDMDPAIAVRSTGSWTTQLAFSFLPAQVASIALSMFGVFGLLLSITGTFGLASYTVSKRMRELSIRVALGAQGRQVLSAALGRMFTLMFTGCLIGLSFGFATSSLLSHIVYQASAQDPIVLIAVVLTVLCTGLLSVAGPVRRAMHVDPANLLREQ